MSVLLLVPDGAIRSARPCLRIISSSIVPPVRYHSSMKHATNWTLNFKKLARWYYSQVNQRKCQKERKQEYYVRQAKHDRSAASAGDETAKVSTSLLDFLQVLCINCDASHHFHYLDFEKKIKMTNSIDFLYDLLYIYIYRRKMKCKNAREGIDWRTRRR